MGSCVFYIFEVEVWDGHPELLEFWTCCKSNPPSTADATQNLKCSMLCPAILSVDGEPEDLLPNIQGDDVVVQGRYSST